MTSSGCSCSAHGSFLTAKGLQEAAERRGASPEGLAVGTSQLYLDKVASVSGARRDEVMMIFDDEVIDEQFERYSSSTRLVS